MNPDKLCLISLGSNIGNRVHYIHQAELLISLHPEIQIEKKSSLLETKALEVTNQPDFINSVMKIRTHLAPECLLGVFQNIEFKIGRIKRFEKGPREIDIDLLYFSDFRINTNALTIPHHSLFTRPFIRKLIQEIGEETIYSKIGDLEHA
ncbi:MAG: 2-amino-4-hydroxy-6-hydroxymethyldihydropteridine diphosphokinase [Leptospiraceae bacterium]|nr:2-amino-4-hydroxy-6-hydroxymethyldihydropteridine diphosphokinase [Leptospiraceae bacterium]MCK6382035.1 2-amino-4-hydroxy-6-hydroxymethyldihydropteridine diphosphokinase [Leptospiraceae bacterium]NUM40800.1 2-amino-4-hydroxy-6-hydroxymethyldihydropteridine diphosphokinase [Leptospiraceae bacterium]